MGGGVGLEGDCEEGILVGVFFSVAVGSVVGLVEGLVEGLVVRVWSARACRTLGWNFFM